PAEPREILLECHDDATKRSERRESRTISSARGAERGREGTRNVTGRCVASIASRSILERGLRALATSPANRSYRKVSVYARANYRAGSSERSSARKGRRRIPEASRAKDAGRLRV